MVFRKTCRYSMVLRFFGSLKSKYSLTMEPKNKKIMGPKVKKSNKSRKSPNKS